MIRDDDEDNHAHMTAIRPHYLRCGKVLTHSAHSLYRCWGPCGSSRESLNSMESICSNRWRTRREAFRSNSCNNNRGRYNKPRQYDVTKNGTRISSLTRKTNYTFCVCVGVSTPLLRST